MSIDLSHISLADNHCHGIYRVQNPMDIKMWRQHFTESHDQAMRDMLHECYPYTREGAYLATVYENAYLDLSYGIPFLGYSEMLDFTRAALSVAPFSKLLYSSDAVGVPELHWLSASTGRRIVGQVLEECVASGDLNAGDVEEAANAILRDNALHLYKVQEGE